MLSKHGCKTEDVSSYIKAEKLQLRRHRHLKSANLRCVVRVIFKILVVMTRVSSYQVCKVVSSHISLQNLGSACQFCIFFGEIFRLYILFFSFELQQSETAQKIRSDKYC